MKDLKIIQQKTVKEIQMIIKYNEENVNVDFIVDVENLEIFYEEVKVYNEEWFNNYKDKAFGTCLEKSFNLYYLRNGIISEVGEICDIVKKSIRDGHKIEDQIEKIHLELGDVLWYTALIKKWYEENDFADWQKFDSEFYEYVSITNELSTMSLDLSYCVNNYIGIGSEDETVLSHLLQLISNFAKLTGSTLEKVAQKNIDKLYSRKERNAIQGSGDFR